MTDELTLVEPSEYLRHAFLDLAADFQRYGEFYNYHEMAQRDFPAYLTEIRKMKDGVGRMPGFAPMTTFWLVLNDLLVVGESRLRHELNATLKIEGGHIGYAIRPGFRRLGYGTLILALTLEKARQAGLTRVLVTCDTDNIPSARIIEKNCGVLEDTVLSLFSGKQVSRYWIDL